MADRDVPRPKAPSADAPEERYRITFRDGAAKKSWDVLCRERRTNMTECWDHLAFSPSQDLPRTCKPLVGRFAMSGLRQYAVGPKQRVWYLVRGARVTVVTVHRTHPKATD